jgi:hypothetical protein
VPMPDDVEIRRVAAEHVRLQGPGVVEWLIGQAELAEVQGNTDAANTWREIAATAALILKSHSERII